jgi:O-antigen ligase
MELAGFRVKDALRWTWGGLMDGRPGLLAAFSALVAGVLVLPMTIGVLDEKKILLIAAVLSVAPLGGVLRVRLLPVVPALVFVPVGICYHMLSEWLVIGLGFTALCASGFVPLRGPEAWLLRLFGAFVLLTMTSLVNSGDLYYSVISYGHFLAVLCTAGLMAVYARTPERFYGILRVFLVLAVANSLHILARGSLSRFFGFGGVMFIDYAGLGIVGCSIAAFFARGGRRILFIALAALLMTGLAATQTRNPFPVIFGTGCFLAVVAFVKNRALGVSRARVLGVALLVFVIVGLVVAIVLLTQKGLASRVADASIEEMVIENEDDIGQNSLLTRVLIWDTALNAFKAHPILGIGMFSFPRVSATWATIPESIHDLYVEGRSPHIGYLMVLCEAGMVGLAGFLVFVGAWLITAMRSVEKHPHESILQCRFLALGTTTYLALSLVVTDAWLMGNGSVVLGGILGLSVGAASMKNEESGGKPGSETGV